MNRRELFQMLFGGAVGAVVAKALPAATLKEVPLLSDLSWTPSAAKTPSKYWIALFEGDPLGLDAREASSPGANGYERQPFRQGETLNFGPATEEGGWGSLDHVGVFDADGVLVDSVSMNRMAPIERDCSARVDLCGLILNADQEDVDGFYVGGSDEELDYLSEEWSEWL